MLLDATMHEQLELPFPPSKDATNVNAPIQSKEASDDTL